MQGPTIISKKLERIAAQERKKKHVTSTGEGGKGEESLMSRTKESENIVLGLYSLF